MSTAAPLPDLRTEYPPHAPGADPKEPSTLLGLLPGIALLAVVGYAGKFVEHFINTYGKAHHLVLPNIEYVLWAILFGVLIANTIGLPRIFRAGVATYEFWLKAGIILLGARFILGDILKLGGISLILVFIAFATQGAIDADEEDSSTAIAAILALGAISLFTFPLIGHLLHMSDHAYGLWAGLAVDNTAEATAAGALYSDAAGKFAVLAKTCRNALIGFVVLGYAIQWARKGLASRTATSQLDNKATFLWKKFPKFVLGFLFISLLATLGSSPNPTLAALGFNKAQLLTLGNLSRWAFLLTFAGVGLRTNLKDLFKQGARPFIVGAVGEVAIAAITLLLVLGADHFYHL